MLNENTRWHCTFTILKINSEFITILSRFHPMSIFLPKSQPFLCGHRSQTKPPPDPAGHHSFPMGLSPCTPLWMSRAWAWAAWETRGRRQHLSLFRDAREPRMKCVCKISAAPHQARLWNAMISENAEQHYVRGMWASTVHAYTQHIGVLSHRVCGGASEGDGPQTGFCALALLLI